MSEESCFISKTFTKSRAFIPRKNITLANNKMDWNFTFTCKFFHKRVHPLESPEAQLHCNQLSKSQDLLLCNLILKQKFIGICDNVITINALTKTVFWNFIWINPVTSSVIPD